jgi:O-antigen/teichoic acid export membrane protein
MTVDPTTQGANAADIAALALLQQYRADALSRIQKRAASWIAGLVAVTGVITTAVVIKGPDSIESLSEPCRALVIALVVAGGLLIANGIFRAYSAAYGDPFDQHDDLETRAAKHQIEGASAAWNTAIANTAKDARAQLDKAAWSTIVGTACLALAILLTWIKASDDPVTYTCFKSGTETIKIEGSAPTVSEGQLTIIPCPS